MPRASPMKSAFNAGEISPRVVGRVDIDRYDKACATLHNFIPMIQGPVRKRPGTRFIDEVKDSSQAGRLVRFEFSDEQAYILLFGPLYVRIYRDEGRLDDGGSPVEVVTPYTEAELFELSVEAQSADTLYIAHKNHAPRKLIRTDATTWSLETISFFDGPYNEIGDPDIDLTLDTAADLFPGDSVNVTASSGLFTVNQDEGRHLRIKRAFSGNNRVWMSVIIDTVNSPTDVDCTVERGENEGGGAGTATSAWRLGAWYGGSAKKNWPAVVAFHDQRLVYAGDPDHPQTFYGSVSGDFEAFVQTGRVGRTETIYDLDAGDSGDDVVDDNAYVFTIASNEVNAIQWLASARSLLIGTQSGIWTAQASRQQEVITPTNISVIRALTKGANATAPAGIEQSVFYVSKSGRKVYLVGFSLERDTFVPEDLTLLAEHITGMGVSELVFQNEPDPTAWMARADGQLIGIAFNAQQEVAGWHRHTVGGSFSGGGAVVESVAVIPATTGSVTTGAHDNPGHDQLWLLVKRTIDGQTRRYIEIMEEQFDDGYDLEDAFFVDSGVSYSGAATTTISGLDHLEGETVVACADGSKVSGLTVASGQVELPNEASRVHVGLPYESRVRDLPLEGGDLRNSTRGSVYAVKKATFGLDLSLGGEVAVDSEGEDFEPLVFNEGDDPMGSPPALYTGDYTHDVDMGVALRNQVEVRHSDPYPFTLLGWVLDVNYGESGAVA